MASRRKHKIPTAERLRELLTYNPETGVFTWNSCCWRFGGQVAGSFGVSAEGYLTIQVDKIRYRANMLAYLYMTGSWPDNPVAYINRDREDNRWCNLVMVDNSKLRQMQPMTRSNSSGYKGVSFRASRRKWRAYIKVNGKQIHLGYHDTRGSATRAYKDAAYKYYGDCTDTITP